MPEPFVKWEAPYASAQLNRKFSRVFPGGVRHGFWVSVTGTDEVTVDTSTPDGSMDPINLVLVDRNGYQLTIREQNARALTVPEPDALYHVIVEADYTIGQATTTQVKIVEDGNQAGHQVIVGSVERSGGSLAALPFAYRQEAFVGADATTAVKLNDESVSTSTTLQQDNDLIVPLKRNRAYLFNLDLFLNEGGGNLKVQFTPPGNRSVVATGFKRVDDNTMNANLNPSPGVYVSENQAYSIEFSDDIHESIQGKISEGQGGDFVFEWAQGNLSSGATTVKQESYLRVVEQTN